MVSAQCTQSVAASGIHLGLRLPCPATRYIAIEPRTLSMHRMRRIGAEALAGQYPLRQCCSVLVSVGRVVGAERGRVARQSGRSRRPHPPGYLDSSAPCEVVTAPGGDTVSGQLEEAVWGRPCPSVGRTVVAGKWQAVRPGRGGELRMEGCDL